VRDWLIEKALEDYESGKLTLWQAAIRCGLFLWEAIHEVKKREIHVALSLNYYSTCAEVALEVLPIEGVSLKAFLEAATRAIDDLPNPLKRTGAGRPRFDYRSRITALLVKTWLNKGYRDTEVYLNDNTETLATFSLQVPDHNTIWRTITFLSESYLKELNQKVAVNLKKGNDA